MLFAVFRELTQLKDSVPPFEKQHIDMLSVVLLHQLLEKENQYSKFASFCRGEYQGTTFINDQNNSWPCCDPFLKGCSNLSTSWIC
jgi:hypothetical protein